jgi:hypothetical protein
MTTPNSEVKIPILDYLLELLKLMDPRELNPKGWEEFKRGSKGLLKLYPEDDYIPVYIEGGLEPTVEMQPYAAMGKLKTIEYGLSDEEFARRKERIRQGDFAKLLLDGFTAKFESIQQIMIEAEQFQLQERFTSTSNFLSEGIAKETMSTKQYSEVILNNTLGSMEN